ncbi:hypothetical protein BH10PAT2_BH10PAT2_3230 [soil metagenome]
MQVSAKSLSKKQTDVLINHFATAICEMNKMNHALGFIEGFFTSTEQVVLAKRLAIGLMLQKKMAYEDIKKNLNVSSATISGVSVMMKTPGFKLAIEKIAEEEWAESQLSKVTKLFRKLKL